MKTFVRCLIQRIPLRLMVGGMLLLSAVPAAVAFDQWGDNGSNPVGGGNGGGPPGGGPPNGNGPNDGEPVVIFNGQYLLDATDINIPGRMNLLLHRQYRSGTDYQGMFGRGWNCDYNERILVLATNGNLLLRRANTQLDVFTNINNVSFSSPAGIFDTLVRNLDGSYTLRDKNGGIRNYNINGCLTEVRDRNGNQMLLTYDPAGKGPISAISDFSHFTNAILIARDYRITRIEVAHNYALSGRYLQFFYDPNGRVTNVTDFAGRAWTYGYDPSGSGTLTSVTTPPASGFPTGIVTRYTYNSTNRLLETVVDKSGNGVVTNKYDSQGRVIQQYWGAATWWFAYPDATNRWVTNGLGHRVQRIFNTNGLMLERRDYTAGLRPTDPPFYSTKYGYTNNDHATKVISPGSNVVASLFDSFGNMLEMRRKAADVTNSPQDIVVSYTYEPVFNFVKTSTDARGYVTTNIYDYENAVYGTTNGNRMRVLLPTVAAGSPAFSFGYNIYGQVDSITNQVGVVTRLVYDTNGFVVRRIDAFGSTEAATNTYTVDLRGNVTSITDPRGNTTTNQYDNLDRLIQFTQPSPFNYVGKYSYTGNGKIAQLEMQTSDVTHPWETNSFVYDLLDHTSALVDGAAHTTQFFFDAAGNQTNVVDSNGNSIRNLFDERQLLWKLIDAQTNTTIHGYTLNGKLAWTADARSNVVSYYYDAYDRLTNITYPDTSFENFAFDPNGNVLAQRSRAGLWTTNAFDPLNNLIQKLRSDGSTVTYQYDLAGRQLSATDPTGAVSFGYDALGRLTATTNALGKRVAHQYDRAGNRTRLTDPENVFIDYGFDSLNRLTNIIYAVTNTVAVYTYDALGRRIQTDFGNGIRGTTAYDWANLPTNLVYTVTNTGTTLGRQAFTFDNAGNRLTMQTTGGVYPGLHTYSYNKTYQLTQVQYPAGFPFPNTVYNYDSMGNRTNTTGGGSVSYTPNNLNQYSVVGGQAYSHSVNGNLTSDSVSLLNYNNENQITFAAKSGTAASYAYDPAGLRVQKVVNGVTRNFVYDGSGPVAVLLGEYDAAGNPLVKYVFNGVTPVAMAVSNSIYSTHCDHLARPFLMTDRTGALVWQANYAAFGQAALVGTNTADINMRSAGQDQDKETSLFYNLARYYNPAIGRFQSFDPAMEATSPLFAQVQGANAYAYVGNNAVNAADPNGNISIFFIICSGPLPVCSVSLICSGQAIVGACSVGLICSGQGGVASACSASLVACSGQVGAYGASACSGNVVGACSGQASYAGVGACSGQVAGVCSGQAGIVGASACSANAIGGCSAQAGIGGSACSASGAGACSAQIGAGASACSAQGAGACSVQVGPGASACSAQGAGACSAQPNFPGPFGCSAQGAGTCSASTASGCNPPKNARLWRQPTDDEPAYASLHRANRKLVTGLSIGRETSGEMGMRFIAQGYSRFTALTAEPGTTRWLPVGSGLVGDNTVTQFRAGGSVHHGAMLVKLRLETRKGEVADFGPFTIEPAPTAETAASRETSRKPLLAALLPLLLGGLCCILLPGKLD